jgi:hypothetical protein
MHRIHDLNACGLSFWSLHSCNSLFSPVCNPTRHAYEQEGRWRRAPLAHTKYGYAPIHMADLYGVPLPFSELDAAIERLFGPTVVRRKILSEATEDLDSLVRLAQQAPPLDDKLLLTSEQMTKIEMELEEEAQARAALREQEARREEIEAKQAAKERLAASARPSMSAQPYKDSLGNTEMSAQPQLPSAAPPPAAGAAPPPPPPPDHPPPPSHSYEMEAASVQAATTRPGKDPEEETSKERPLAAGKNHEEETKKERPLAAAAANLAAFAWKGKSLKKASADADSQHPTSTNLDAAAPAATCTATAGGGVCGVASGGGSGSSSDKSKASSAHGALPSSGQVGSNKSSFCVEVRVTPPSQECIKLAVAHIKVMNL